MLWDDICLSLAIMKTGGLDCDLLYYRRTAGTHSSLTIMESSLSLPGACRTATSESRCLCPSAVSHPGRLNHGKH